ncbi:MAG TPA: alpha/beta hydrolase [Dehalococcoidia bacterium]
MPEFDSNGVSINYIDEGSGPAVVLVHGFASSLQGNWRAPGIVDALIATGRRVVALDCRGHGRSGKPHDPTAYDGTKMADDVIALMDHLHIDVADLMGYSMGGGIAASLLVRHPERFRSVILAGVGDGIVLGVRPRARSEAIANAMQAPAGTRVEDETARNFRTFAERSGNDLEALAAIQRARRGGNGPSRIGEVTLPVMVLIGEHDTLVGSGDKLAAAIPGAKLVKVPGDHLTAVGQPQFRQAIVDFLAHQSPVAAG